MARLRKEEVFPLIKGVVSGELSRSDFDELTNLKPGGYEYWLRKYKKEQGSNGSFVAVRRKKKVDKEGQVEVILGRDVQIKFSRLVSAQYLRELIEGK
jgi:hypothetical protein